MAFAIIKTEGHGLAQFVVDTADEVSALPTVEYDPGSEAFCVETGDTYILSAGREWTVKLAPAAPEAEDDTEPAAEET